MLTEKTKDFLDLDGDLKFMQRLKDFMVKRKSGSDRPSTKFLKRFIQDLKVIFADKTFIKAIYEIREKLEIPKDGFDINQNETAFKQWLEGTYKDSFKKIKTVLGGYSNIITSSPEEALEPLINAVLYDKEGKDFYYNKHDLFQGCYSLEMYENYVNEKPFPGILQFILFQDVFLPANNFTVLMHRSSYIVLAISASTTKRDVEELWPEIDKWQKEMAGYTKNKKRFKKNLDEGLAILDYDETTKQNIEKDKLMGESKQRYLSVRLYDEVDNKLYSDKEVNNEVELKKDEQRYLQKRRKIKSRIKKLVEPK